MTPVLSGLYFISFLYLTDILRGGVDSIANLGGNCRSYGKMIGKSFDREGVFVRFQETASEVALVSAELVTSQ